MTDALTATAYQDRTKESDFRHTVRDAALWRGWAVVMEVSDAAYRLLAETARRNVKQAYLCPPDGWPDLTLGRDNSDGTARILFVELKTGRGRLSRAQTETLDLLRRAGCEVYVWRPTDPWDDILAVLA